MFKKSIFALALAGLMVSTSARAMYSEAATALDWATVAVVAYVVKWTYDKLAQHHEKAVDNRLTKNALETRHRQIDQVDDELMREEGLLPS